MKTMTQFPKKIRITLREDISNAPIANVQSQIHLFATRKNDFYISLPFSDSNGEILIIDEYLAKEIYIVSAFYLMDYASGLTTCKPQFEIEVRAGADVNKAASNLKKALLTYGCLDCGLDMDYIEAMFRADNHLYKPKTQLFTFDGTKECECLDIEMLLERAD